MWAGDRQSSGESALPAQVITLRRLKVALLAAVLIPTLLLVAGAWDQRTQLIRAAENDALATVTALREHALKAIETHELLIREVDSRTRDMSWDQIREASGKLSADISAMHAGMPEVSAIAITDASGRRWAGSGDTSRNGRVSLTDREYWYAQRDADRGTFISRTYIGSLTGQQAFGISRRRTSANGTFDGTVHVSIAASYFSDFWADVLAGRSEAAIALIRLDGEVLARLPETAAGSARATAEIAPLLTMDKAAPRSGVFRATAASDGIERIIGYSRVGNYPLIVGYSTTVPAVLAPWRQHLLDFGGVGILATAALVLAVFVTMRQVRRLMAEQTRRLAIERAVQKGQPLELLGQLTAGIAHDFANILQATQVVVTLLKHAADQPERVRSLADRLGEDIERGTSLTRRMMDLVRAGRAEKRPSDQDGLINPAEEMARVSEMLPRLLGSRYRFQFEMSAELPVFVRGDRAELEVAVMNLAVNARDAMPDGGEIVVRTVLENVVRRPRGTDLGRRAGLAPGLCLRVSVTDTGVGMSPEVLAQAGVPFFTTKPRGRGTGLGLAGARGFAERAGGQLSIESEVGRGTTVTLWLPAIAPRKARPETRSVEQAGYAA